MGSERRDGMEARRLLDACDGLVLDRLGLDGHGVGTRLRPRKKARESHDCDSFPAPRGIPSNKALTPLRPKISLSASSGWSGTDHFAGSTGMRSTPTDADSEPVRLDHVPAMWPRSPRQVRTSSQCEITYRSCHAAGRWQKRSRRNGEAAASGSPRDRSLRYRAPIFREVERTTEVRDGARSGVTSLSPRPLLRLAEQGAQLVDQLPRAGPTPIERLDPLEPFEDRPGLVHPTEGSPERLTEG